MTGCLGVFTYDRADGRTLNGANKSAFVASTDHDVTGLPVATLPGADVRDLAHDAAAKRLWAADSKARLWIIPLDGGAPEDITESLPLSWLGRRGADSVAVDPGNPRIVYVAKPGNDYLSDVAGLRSLDGGATWHSLNTPAFGVEEAREARWVRVNPKTREAWFATGCFGLWRLPLSPRFRPTQRPRPERRDHALLIGNWIVLVNHRHTAPVREQTQQQNRNRDQ